MAPPKAANETLSGLFAPPRDHLHGVGGVLCAYSADAEFLDQCLARFSRVSNQSRLARGSIDWTLMLDPEHAVLPSSEVGGLLQLRPRAASERPWEFHCMHAKVALLAFGPSRTGEPTWYRIVVSTGNWTRESACHQLELAWFLDIDLASPVLADLDELRAVVGFLQGLSRCYQTSDTLGLGARRLLVQAAGRGDPETSSGPLRFMATLPCSGEATPGGLLPQIRVRLGVAASRFSTIVCGSGFFERGRDPAEQPKVLKELVEQLAHHLTRGPTKRLVANATGDDQVITAFRAGKLKDWSLHHPKDPPPAPQPGRLRLHAKFLFLARRREDAFSGGRLYLGSGNLSVRGFLLGPRLSGAANPAHYGNVEAGVLLEVPEIATESQLHRALPVGPPINALELAAIAIKPQEDAEADVVAPPAPILAFVCGDALHVGVEWDDTVEVPDGVRVMVPGASDVVLAALQASFDYPLPDLPRSLEIRWGSEVCTVPCLNSRGEFPRQAKTYPHFGSWLESLSGFPQTWDDPDDDPGEEEEEGTQTGGGTVPKELRCGTRDFPARTAMLLVETIAELNGTIPEDRASDWVHALRHQLLVETPLDQLPGWQGLRLNFLRVLLSTRGFAPNWADRSGYEALIHAVAHDWQLDGLPALEVER